VCAQGGEDQLVRRCAREAIGGGAIEADFGPKSVRASAPALTRRSPADISIPATVSERLGIAYRLPFSGSPIVQLV
jgi:hypothetical protein